MKLAKSWAGDPLYASSLNISVCNENMVAVDLLAADGSVFGHGHLDLETAEAFHQRWGQTLNELRRKQAN